MAKLDPRRWVIVATYVSPGVAAGAGGFVIVNGKIIRVPPRGPVMKQLSEVLSKVATSRRGR
ncbi:MAG TPA: hypothetical protein VLT86_19685 [Vicinamibacterales bacterium]|nr:hypothetical protein [Vicinamibacterales bacterium]